MWRAWVLCPLLRLPPERARNFNPRDKALTASIREGLSKIFSEDLEMLERQQRNPLAWPGRGGGKSSSTSIPAGCMRGGCGTA